MKAWSKPKVNPQIEKNLNPLATKPEKETMHLIDAEFNITYQNNQGIIKVRPLLRT